MRMNQARRPEKKRPAFGSTDEQVLASRGLETLVPGLRLVLAVVITKLNRRKELR
jgi:hypothetical protein